LAVNNDIKANRTGDRFLRSFQRLISTVKIYQENHPILSECAQEFIGAASEWWEDDDFLTLYTSHERFIIQEEKLHYRRENVKLIHELLQYFEKRRIPGVRFCSDLKALPSERLIEFVLMLNQAEQESDPLKWIERQIRDNGCSWVEIVQPEEGIAQERDLERREAAKRTYAYAMESIKEASSKVLSNRRAGVRKIQRVVQDMVNILMEDDSVLIYMSTIRQHDDYTYTHSVNVATLALCLGKRIGLSRVSLKRLGICGLVHDLGKVQIPLEILNKPGKLERDEMEEMERHPLKSVAQIIKLRASRELKAKIMRPPFEHHLKYDLSGYPRIKRKVPISLFGRILSIADVFDALTSPRIYRKTALSPDRALGMMMKGSGKDFDPILLKVFANMLGVYPVGTIMELDTGEIGLVIDNPEKRDRMRPRIMLMSPNLEGGYVKGGVVDLNEWNPTTGSYTRNVRKSSHPSVYGIQPAEFLL
jgi:HD-GYP domain-containing protein (c-di-GMP phosphodiesterase class II)